jgi:hypothetical protein
MLGRLYARESAVVLVGAIGGEGCRAGLCWIMGTCNARGVVCCGGYGARLLFGMMFACGRGPVVVICTCECRGGAMLTHHSLGPVGSRVPVRIWLLKLSWISRWCLSMNAVQPALHSLPRLRRLFVKPGMIGPVRASMVGMVGSANCALAMEVFASPVAVRMVVHGAERSRFRTGIGAELMK